MPMGGVEAPTITPLRLPEAGKPINHIDTNTNIEIKIPAAGGQVFFTTNGQRPDPFARFNDKNTIRYTGPFQLNEGRRVIKALAVSRNGKQESKMVTKNFTVEYASSDQMDQPPEDDDTSFQMEYRPKPSSARFASTGTGRQLAVATPVMNPYSPYPTQVATRGPNSMGYSHAGPLNSYNPPVERITDAFRNGQKSPDYFFHYHLHDSPRQGMGSTYPPAAPVNVDPSAWNPVSVPIPAVINQSIGTQTTGLFYPTNNAQPVQAQALQTSFGTEDIRALKDMTVKEAAKPKLQEVSAGRGFWKKQLEHIAAHLEAYTQKDTSFRAAVGQPRMGRINAATVEEEDDDICLVISFQRKGDRLSAGNKALAKKIYDSDQGSVSSMGRRPKKPVRGKAPPKKKAEPKGAWSKLSGAEYRLLKELGPKGSGDAEEVEDLLKEANASCVNEDGIPALTLAVMNNHVECIPLLIEAGAEVNKKVENRKGNTPLHEAVLLGPDGQEAIESLLENDANPKKKNDKNETPYDLAVKKGYESVVTILASSMGQGIVDKFSDKGSRRGSAASAKSRSYKEKRSKDEGTVKEKANLDTKADCEALRKAMKGFGTDEKAITGILTQRSNRQRQKIAKEYKTMFGKDLLKEFKSEMSGKLLDVIMGLMSKPADYDAHELHKAISGLGTDEEVLIEIICTRTNAEIEAIKDAYEKVNDSPLEDDVVSDTSGHFRRILVSCLQGNRPEDDVVDPDLAKSDAQALYEAGEKKWGTDESRFNVIMCSRSYAQLRATFKAYSEVSKNDIEQAIKKEMSGDIKDSMLAIVRCVRNKSKYFSDKLYKKMKGLGTSDQDLIRIVVSRCEVDMINIKKEFQAAYNQTLGKFIAGDTSGDYKKILLGLVGGEN